MARIAGVDLPKKKRVEYGLTYIYGVGLYASRQILDATGIDYNKRVHELDEADVAAITKEIRENHMVEGDLRKKEATNGLALSSLSYPTRCGSSIHSGSIKSSLRRSSSASSNSTTMCVLWTIVEWMRRKR